MGVVTDEYRDERCRHIMAAAKRCFVRNGFHATSVQQILEEAQISAGGLYRYFRSKDEIVLAVAGEALDRFKSSITETFDPADPLPLPELLEQALATMERIDEADQVALIAVQVWATATYTPELATAVSELIDTVSGMLAGIVASYQRTGALPTGTPPEEIARVLVTLLPGFVLQRTILGARASDFTPGLAALFA